MAEKTRAKKSLNFTVKALDSLPTAEPGKRSYYYDTNTRSLAVAVTDRGTKTFILYRWIQGKPERILLGHYLDGNQGMTIEQARGKASEHIGTISKGENPADKRRLDRQEMTLQQFFDEYLERHAKVRKRTWKEDKSKFDQYLASSADGINLAVRKLSTIKKSDLAALHSKIGKPHPTTANRVLALTSSIFGRAIEWGLWEGQNPCRGIRRYKEVSRERFLQADELPRFFAALSAEANETVRDCITMALLTGARRSNVQAMRWEDITLTDDRNEWRIPRTKTGEPHTLPIAPQAVVILKRRRDNADEDAIYVFPKQKDSTRKPDDGKPGHIVELKRAWARILKTAKLSELRIHDLRRTLGSWQAAMGASLQVIGKTLAHKNVSTTAIYSRLNLDPVKQSITEATNAMLIAGGVITAAPTVTPMKKRRAK